MTSDKNCNVAKCNHATQKVELDDRLSKLEKFQTRLEEIIQNLQAYVATHRNVQKTVKEAVKTAVELVTSHKKAMQEKVESEGKKNPAAIEEEEKKKKKRKPKQKKKAKGTNDKEETSETWTKVQRKKKKKPVTKDQAPKRSPLTMFSLVLKGF
jgi:uncharacterized coiled-coil protein SlyX